MLKFSNVLLLICLTLAPVYAWSQQTDPLKAAKNADQIDLVMLPFSQSFEIIKPQVDEWAKCDAAALFAREIYTTKMQEVSSKLRSNVLTLLPTVEDNAKLYQLEIEYNRSFWFHKGYFDGLSTAMNVSVEQVADEQAKNCISKIIE